MSSNQIVRSVCLFTSQPNTQMPNRVNAIARILEGAGFIIQTKRICSPTHDVVEFKRLVWDQEFYLSVGTVNLQKAKELLPQIYAAQRVNMNVDLTHEQITSEHAQLLFDIIHRDAQKTFNVAYVFNNTPSSPFFPSAAYERDGFSIGLQATDCSQGVEHLDEWFVTMQALWMQIKDLFKNESDFLGIDSSVAPLFEGKGSLVNLITRLGYSFPRSTTTDVYTAITRFIKESNPMRVGLCGLMFPCLEDFELAAEYERGEFSIERNLFLSLHSGLGIDTYPIGVDESPERVVEILRLVQALSHKYSKPLSARFVSDGKARVGEKTNFQNKFLKDVTIRAL